LFTDRLRVIASVAGEVNVNHGRSPMKKSDSKSMRMATGRSCPALCATLLLLTRISAAGADTPPPDGVWTGKGQGSSGREEARLGHDGERRL
jgi:hypothetical protein